MRRITMNIGKSKIGKGLLGGISAFILVLSLIVFLGTAAFAEEDESIFSPSIELKVQQIDLDGDGKRLQTIANVSGISETDGDFVVTLYYNTSNKKVGISGDGENQINKLNINTGKTYELHAELKKGDEVVATSSNVAVNVYGQTLDKADITVNASYEGETTGEIVVNGADGFSVYREGDKNFKRRKKTCNRKY